MNGFIKFVVFVRYIQNLNMTWMQIILLIFILTFLLLEMFIVFISLIADRRRAVKYMPIVLMTIAIGVADIYAGQIAEIIVNNI